MGNTPKTLDSKKVYFVVDADTKFAANGKVPQGTLLALAEAESRGDNEMLTKLIGRFIKKVVLDEEYFKLIDWIDDNGLEDLVQPILDYVAEVTGSPKDSTK